MMTTRRDALATIGLGLALGSGLARAEAYPTKPVRLVIPFPPGGPTDVIGRTAGQAISDLGRPAVMDNRPGAAGTIGSDVVAKSAPDGYTLVMGNISTHAINAHVYKSMPYDPIKDFTPICGLVAPLMTVSVHPSVPVNSIAELIAYAKKNPGKLSFASSGLGSPHHLAGAELNQMAGIDLVHVPYKGAAPAVTDVVAGQCPVGCLSLSVALPFHRSGKLRILAMTETTRAPLLPEIPTVSETLKGFEMTNWQGLFGPANLPPDIVQVIQRECLQKFTASKASLEAEGLGLFFKEPVSFAAFVAAESEKWGRFVKALGITAD